MFSADQIAQLQAPIDPGRVSQREGGRGNKLSYIEAHDAINTANAIFGFDGWTMAIQQFAPLGGGNYYALVQVSAGGVSRTDIGYGAARNDTPDEVDKAIKSAVSDGMKRALRTFGNQFGNSLYDKDQPQTNPAPARAATTPARAATPAQNGGGPAKITDKQINFALRIAKDNGLTPADVDRLAQERHNAAGLRGLSLRDASTFIDFLKEQDAPVGDDPLDDVPF